MPGRGVRFPHYAPSGAAGVRTDRTPAALAAAISITMAINRCESREAGKVKTAFPESRVLEMDETDEERSGAAECHDDLPSQFLRRRDLANVSKATASTMMTPMMICWM